MDKRSVGEDEFHLFFASPDEAVRHDLIPRYLSMLDVAERERASRFRFEQDRLSFIVGHALVRATLGCYLGVSGSELDFVKNAWGRPGLSRQDAPLDFNLSRSRGLVLLGVSAGREIGVDVELSRREGVVEVADHYFAPSEVSALRKLPATEQVDRFFDYWTLKESYIKGRGMGLSLALDKFAFDRRAEGPIALDVDPELGDDGSTWGFVLLEAGPDHRAAAAVRLLGARVVWSAWKSIPLREEKTFRPRVLGRSPAIAAPAPPS